MDKARKETGKTGTLICVRGSAVHPTPGDLFLGLKVLPALRFGFRDGITNRRANAVISTNTIAERNGLLHVIEGL